MVICYPLQNQNDYIELKYSLRSLKFLTEPFEVVIVGDKIPDWITSITQIKLPDIPGQKQISIKRKILAALEYSQTIFFMNDDIFLMKPTDPNSYPYYWSGKLKAIRESGTKPLQTALEAVKKPIKHFDVHTPIIYDQRFKEIAEKYPQHTIIKSMYSNHLEIEGTEMTDCKILKEGSQEAIKQRINGSPCFSSSAGGLKSTLKVLRELFPYKSKYEL
jgi:hypothetical protein